MMIDHDSIETDTLRVYVEQFKAIELAYKDRKYRVVERENGIQLERVNS